MNKKAIFKRFENADSETIKVLSGYIGMENNAVKQRIFKKSMDKYLQRTSDSDSMGKNYARITDVTEVKRTGRALRIALSAAAAACAAAVGVWVVRPMLKQPDTLGNSTVISKQTVNGRELWTAVPPDQASKEDICWLMMNSIFYYDKVSGRAEYSYPTDDENITEYTFADFQYCLSEDRSYVKIQKRTDDLEKMYDSSHGPMYGVEEKELYERYSEGNKIIKKDLNTNEISSSVDEHHKSIFDIEPVPDSERLKYADEEKTIISPDTYYPDPTPEMEHDFSFFQQRLAAAAMRDMDKWYTDSIINVNGRECYHILLSITDNDTENDYKLKNAEIWVDVKTGIVMKMLLTDNNNTLVCGSLMTEIRYEDEAEPVTPMPDDVKAEKDAFDELTGSDDIDVLTRNIVKMQEQLNELDAKIEKLKGPNSTVLPEEEKQTSLADLEEKRNAVKSALEEMQEKLRKELEKESAKLDELYEDTNEQLKRLNELKKQYGNKTAESTDSRKLDKAVSPEKAAKKDVYHLLLNSIDYYDRASGTVYLPCGNNFDMVSKIEFQTVLSGSKAYQHYTSYYIDDINSSDMASIKEISKRSIESIDDMEFFCDVKNNICISSNNISKEYENTDCFITIDNVAKIEDDERVTVETDGQPCYSYRADPTNVPDASSVCLFAQGLTMGYLQDFSRWDIKGTAKYEDKECFCISGTASKEYGAKHNVTRFDFWVDSKTGVLLQYAGYDENGNISDYIYTENIAFDNSALDVKNFSKSFIEGYKTIG